MTTEESTLNREDLSPEARWSYYVTAYSMRDPTEGVAFSEMRMPFLKRNLPGKLDEDEEYDRFYRRLQHYDGLVIRICANNYTILYQPPTHDWFWRSNAPVPDKDVDVETAQSQIQTRGEEQRQEHAALKEKRHDRFVEKFVNNPNWARGLSKDKVDESNQRFRSWLDGTLKESPIPVSGSAEGESKGETGDGGEGKTKTEVDVQGENTGVGASVNPETTTDTGPIAEAAPSVPEEKEEEKKKEEAKVEPTDTEMADAEPVDTTVPASDSTAPVPEPES